MLSVHTSPRFSRRRLLGASVVLGASVSLLGLPASPASAAKSLPTPTNITFTNVTAQSFTVNVGSGTGSTIYSVYIDGVLFADATYSGFTVRDRTQNTDYTVRVQQILLPSGRTSALSAPKTVHTLVYVPPVLPNAPTNPQVSAVTATSARLAWTQSTTSGVSYNVYLNGVVQLNTSATSATVQGLLDSNGSPIPGTGLRPGIANRIGVESVTAGGVASSIAEVTVNAPGTAVGVPPSPANLRVVSVTNHSIGVAWEQSVDSQFYDSTLSYQFIVNGRAAKYTCSQYCFGATGGGVYQLAPGTTYRIGVQTIGGNGVYSPIVDVTATTTAP